MVSFRGTLGCGTQKRKRHIYIYIYASLPQTHLFITIWKEYVYIYVKNNIYIYINTHTSAPLNSAKYVSHHAQMTVKTFPISSEYVCQHYRRPVRLDRVPATPEQRSCNWQAGRVVGVSFHSGGPLRTRMKKPGIGMTLACTDSSLLWYIKGPFRHESNQNTHEATR